VKDKVKSKSTLMKDAVALFLITLISGLALSYVYEITKAPIDEQQTIKREKANQAVFVDAVSFEADTALMEQAGDTDLTSLSPDYAGITVEEVSKVLDGAGNTIGYNVTVTTTQSYKDSITLVFGYSKDGTIEGIRIMSISETAGLGMNATKPDFLDQFLNKKTDKFSVTKTGASTEDQIDALSGATITSKAVTNAINAGIGFVKEFALSLGGGQ
jgi:electron transport complex protein RnfG